MLYAIAVVLILIADQSLKYYVTVNIPLNTGEQTFIPHVLSLVNLHNDGAAFGSFSGGTMRWIFVVLAVVISAGIIYLLATGKIKNAGMRWTLTGVLAGAIGNCIDRVMQGYVVDMFRFEFLQDTFFFGAVFNVADMFISCCGVAFILILLFSKDPEKKKAGFDPDGEDDEQPEGSPRRVRFGKVTKDKSEPEQAAEAAPARPYGMGRPETPRASRPEKPEVTAEDFVEVDTNVRAPYTGTGTASAPIPPTHTPSVFAEKPQAAPEKTPEPEKKAPAVEETFTLEDILAEFSEK